MRPAATFLAGRAERGFSLAEMIVVVFLLGVAMLGILAVFDASARINKNEQQVADAQGSVRFGIYQMTRAIRMAGSGGLYLRQAVLNAPDPNLLGTTVPGNKYDNVGAGTFVTPLTGANIPVRPGTDMIEVRGVIGSPLLGFDAATGCGPTFGTSPCTGSTTELKTATTVQGIYPHVNNDAVNRPQFAAVDTYTQGALPANPMLVIVSFGGASIDPTHNGCTLPQNLYNVGTLKAPTTLVASSTFGQIDFDSSVAKEFNTEKPDVLGAVAPGLSTVRRAGVLDDFLYFIDNSDPNHPALAWGTRRGDKFDVVPLADDVEDMQIAYGVDGDNNGAINRTVDPTDTDPDQNVSNQANSDEWAPNVPTEPAYTAAQFVDANNCELLHGVMISLVARSKDPDPTYRSPFAQGIVIMNGLAPAAGTGQFRRRVQTLKINLRNYAFPG
jgi:prepilin-type N-terminal cleavage/methylation domain-containing protein